MEDILKDIGLSGYAYRLKERNFGLRYFINILRSQGNAQGLRQQVMYECGMSSDQVLAICDRV